MRKIISVVIALSMVLSLSACGKTAQTDKKSGNTASKASEQAGNRFSGTIKSVSDSSITITTDDGAEKTFTVNDSTVYTMDMGEMNMGDAQQGGTPPEMPTGDTQQGSTPPEMPTGDNQQGSTPPEMPSGGNQQGSAVPQMPTGDVQQSGATPDMQREGGEGMQMGPEMLTEGTAVTVTVSDDGIASEIKIKSK